MEEVQVFYILTSPKSLDAAKAIPDTVEQNPERRIELRHEPFRPIPAEFRNTRRIWDTEESAVEAAQRWLRDGRYAPTEVLVCRCEVVGTVAKPKPTWTRRKSNG